MTKKFLFWICIIVLGYNLCKIFSIVPDLFPEGWFSPSGMEPWALFWNMAMTIVFSLLAIGVENFFDHYFQIDPRTERKVVYFFLALTTVGATVFAAIATLFDHSLHLALNIGYLWPVYGTALFGLWATMLHARNWAFK